MRFLNLLVLCVVSSVAMATPKQLALTPASQCQTLACVRQNIDVIDNQLVTLLGERFANVQRAGELKKKTATPTHDAARENKILMTAQQQAEQYGYPAMAIRQIFKTILVEANIIENKQ